MNIKDLVEQAYREGYNEALRHYEPPHYEDEAWADSDAKVAVEGYPTTRED